MKTILARLEEKVHRGQTLSEAMGSMEKCFPKLRIKFLTDDARKVPQFIQAMEANGFSMEQSRWQKQETGVQAEILFKPGKDRKVHCCCL